ncbi:FUSC family protein [Ideonella livida]|uniref:Uncharacterized protein n=1 Tax=Ideonella livida TaxID=2707176 RepID=A0A7C9PII7_9BURK|nr:FUSC family protein [Ideonella livida]NDY92877.1 hypothetical protein [Ideonella livida]
MRMQWWRGLGANARNGLQVALGVAGVQLGVGLAAGAQAGLLAAGGAVCVSLLDVPNTPARARRRLLPAVPVAVGVTALLAAVRLLPAGLAQSLALVLAVGAIGGLGQLALAWGARGGALAFAGVLAAVFALSGPAPAWWGQGLVEAAWVGLGGVLGVAWSLACARFSQTHWQRLALADALAATAQVLRVRAPLFSGQLSPGPQGLQVALQTDAAWAAALQTARDLLYGLDPERASAAQQRWLQGLIALSGLRELLLASRVDVELLGHDALGLAWRAELARTLGRMAEALERLADVTRQDGPVPEFSAELWRHDLAGRLAQATPASLPGAGPLPLDVRRPLLDSMQVRLGDLLDDTAALADALAGRPGARVSLRDWPPEALSAFQSPEGWAPAALRRHLHLDSPVARHAARAAVSYAGALALALGLGLLVPWAQHPQWLMLSVAVVLRGNLAQTLARRNDRLVGTVLGCALVALLAAWGQPWAWQLAFFVGVGVAHANVNTAYRRTAAAATVLALVQAHLLQPDQGLPLAERLVDTLLGAGLAWAACYLWPHWERRGLPQRLRQASSLLLAQCQAVLHGQLDPAGQRAQRLCRHQLQAVLDELVASGLRSRAEPRYAQLPQAELQSMLLHAHRATALLGAVQQLRHRRGAQLDPERAQALLAQTVAQAEALLAWPAPGAPDPEPPASLPDAGLTLWPRHEASPDLTPWLQRRLQLLTLELQWLAQALWRLRQP